MLHKGAQFKYKPTSSLSALLVDILINMVLAPYPANFQPLYPFAWSKNLVVCSKHAS